MEYTKTIQEYNLDSSKRLEDKIYWLRNQKNDEVNKIEAEALDIVKTYDMKKVNAMKIIKYLFRGLGIVLSIISILSAGFQFGIIGIIIFGGPCWFLAGLFESREESLKKEVGKKDRPELTAECKERINKLEAEYAENVRKLREEFAKDEAEYKEKFETAVTEMSVRFAKSELLNAIIDKMTKTFKNLISSAKRNTNIENISIPFRATISKDSVDSNAGKFDFDIERYKDLSNVVEIYGLTKALSSALYMNMTLDCSEDPSGTVANYKVDNGNDTFCITYSAVNGYYEAVKEW